MKDLKEICAKKNAVLMSLDETAKKDAVVIVITIKCVTRSSETVVNALMVIKMQNVKKNAVMVPTEKNANTSVENVLML